MVRAILISGGRGSRMGSIGLDTPKCLLRINGKSIIRKQVESLRECGVEDISVVAGYGSELVKSRCRDLNLNFYVDDTGMMNSIHTARNSLSEETILLYGDVYLESDPLKRMLAYQGDFCLAVDNQKIMKFGEEEHAERGTDKKKGSTKAEIKEGRILRLSKGLTEEETGGEYIGIIKMSERGTKLFRQKLEKIVGAGDIKRFPSPSYLINNFIEEGEFVGAVYVNTTDYSEIDYQKDLNEARAKFERA